MRAIQTFILRLLRDSTEPEDLCGNLRRLPQGEIIPFADEQTLLQLLRQDSNRSAEKKVNKEREEIPDNSHFPAKKGEKNE